MKAKIYIETSLAGPCVKDGWYAVAIECETQKGPAMIGTVGMEKETTYYRSVLLAVVLALRKLKPCEAEIHTRCTFIKGMYEQGQPENWRRAEWKKATGDEVENRELWQQFFDEINRMGGRDKITFRHSKNHAYSDLLRDKIRKSQKKYRERAAQNAEKP